jgi:hypothetical protein
LSTIDGVDAVWITRSDPVPRAADAGLPLAGMTFAVKDNIDVAGLPTTAACPDFSYRPERDAPVVRRLPAHTVGSLLSGIPGPLGLGRIGLADGSEVTGFLCEAYATAGALDITAGGGWRSYRLGGHS